MLLLISEGADGSPLVPFVLVATILYLLLAVATSTAARRDKIPPGTYSVIACADVALIFGVTIAFSAPQYYGRVLIFAFLALHLTMFYLGQTAAMSALVATIVLYVAMVYEAIESGAPLHWREELWSLTAFVAAAAALMIEQARLRGRLQVIARLFGRAEEGDFTEEYDEQADTRPDSITVVGRAYNRVREQLANLVLTDPLTGCENRRGFEQSLAREVARAVRAGSEISLLAIDVDHFKNINDTMGHLAGDAVLRDVGEMLLHAARTGDIVARTGGEEFCIVLPDTSPAGASQLATRLCESFRSREFKSGEHTVRITVSIGVVSQSMRGATMHKMADVLKGRADEALYAAKRSGRDRVRVWSPPS